ncbi:uncharacterized N-acetyltransferase p20-like [Zingiber officinale]|uniref:uncharacterized N-acetyltransferase p20-like n=1 Tax=Zingiber officinale TaxID=94328 RepID=UPI001C4C054B|nr:uncharacterized N-acetyltransferase p20-like [Zingiber officinale]
MEPPPTTTATGAITLRKFDLADVDDYMVWASDDRVTALCRWDSYTDKEALLRYMRDVVVPHPWYRAICIDGRPIGAISVYPGAGRDGCKGELGYVLAAAHWGRGYVTEAVRQAMAAVFRELPGLERVEALVDVDNRASQRVLEKVGFQREGVLRKSMLIRGTTRDTVIFSFLSTDPLLPLASKRSSQ